MTGGQYARLEDLQHPAWQQYGVDVKVLRLDEYMPNLSGNKYFKLKYNLAQIKQQQFGTVISFGGAYSNHIHALAYAAKSEGLKAVGVIRGEQSYSQNPTLNDALAWGMELVFVSREEYKLRHDALYQQRLADKYQGTVIPEGGSNQLALQGCAEIVAHINATIGDDYDAVYLPCGTGSTLAGIATCLPQHKRLYGVVVLKGAEYLQTEIAAMLKESELPANISLLHDYHQGGYGKCSKQLAAFVQDFPLPVEPVYSGKLFFALDQMLANNMIAPGSRVVAIHTGGLQGLRGMKPIMDKLLSR